MDRVVEAHADTLGGPPRPSADDLTHGHVRDVTVCKGVDMTDTVSQNVDLTRFEITSDGSLAGFTQYVEAGLQRIFFHTEIGEEFGGRGLAAVLVTAALDATRDAGLRVVPVCPYVKKFIERHEQYQDLADPVTPAAMQAVRAATHS